MTASGQPSGSGLKIGRSSQSALGARMDKPKAVTAAVHKLARLIYTMLTKGEEYIDR